MQIRQPEHDEQRLYHDLAWIWPIISPPEEYVQETEWICRIIRQYSEIEVKTLLHLGCGGGHNDFTLKKHFQMTGIDLSQEMLTLARALNPEVTYVQGDMRTYRSEERFDAVLVADAVSYMLTEEDLHAVFRSAWMHLKPGGALLTFAEVTKERFQQQHTECPTHAKGDIEITYIENYYDPDPADTTYEVTFIYLIRRQGKLELQTDAHLAGIFPLASWPRCLQEVGFQTHQITFEGYDIPTFICVKKPGF